MQMSTISQPIASHVNIRLWASAVIAALTWLVLYNTIQPLSEWISYEALGLAHGSHAGEAVAFFFYDVPKIMLLVSGMIFVITVVRTFFSAERARRLLSGKRVGIGNVRFIE